GGSRSGATLAAARARGFGRGAAQALSWRVALPVILGATALTGGRALRRGLPAGTGSFTAVGAASAFLSTLGAAKALGWGVARKQDPPAAGAAAVRSGLPRARPLLPFALYRCALAAVVARRLRRSQ